MLKYTEEQMTWLPMIKDYIAASFHVDKEDFERTRLIKRVDWAKCGACLEQKQIGLLMN